MTEQYYFMCLHLAAHTVLLSKDWNDAERGACTRLAALNIRVQMRRGEMRYQRPMPGFQGYSIETLINAGALRPRSPAITST